MVGVRSLAFTRAAASTGFFWPDLGSGETEAVLEVSGVSVGLGTWGPPHGLGPMTGSGTWSWCLSSGVTLLPCVRPPWPSWGSPVSPAGPAALSWGQCGRLSPLCCPPAAPAAPGAHLGGGSPCSVCLTVGLTEHSLPNGGSCAGCLVMSDAGDPHVAQPGGGGSAGQDVLTPWAGGARRLLGFVWTRGEEEVRESLPGTWAWL